jgi:hypothetical protein
MKITRNGREIVIEVSAAPCKFLLEDVFDKETAEEIARQARTNPWAWADVTVTARLPRIGIPYGFSCLGECNYESMEEFMDSDTFEWMVEEAVQDLQNKLLDMLDLVEEQARQLGY